jgi:alpha-tubulin suppressor-like RCC1 family protein
LVTNADGKPARGVTVTFAVTGGGTISGTTPVTDSLGIATLASWTLGKKAGLNTVTATVATLAPVTFSVTTRAGAPVQLDRVSGDAQTDTVRATLAAPFVVRVSDAYANPVAGVAVAFTATGAGAAISVASSTTDTLGQAAVALTLGDSAGAYGAQASVPTTQVPSVSFSATAMWPPFRAAVVSVGSQHACAITATSTAYCWGRNSSGAVGDGTTTDRLVPVAVHLPLAFDAISAGADFSCGVAGGSAYCWGYNTQSELGDGTVATRAVPARVAGGLVARSVTAGSAHACLLTTSNDAYCWGLTVFGQVGDGTTGTNQFTRSQPVPVVVGVKFASIAAGGYHTCGIATNGTAYCWGRNTAGALGDGTTTDRLAPVPVSGGLTFTSIDAGLDFTCALTASGAAYCWGVNNLGQLGVGNTTSQLAPTAVAGGLTFSRIAVGLDHACGIASGGHVYCWGNDVAGGAGVPSNLPIIAPRPVRFPSTLTFVGIAAGEVNSCAITSDATTYCWGLNLAGASGDGTTAYHNTPVTVRSR